MATSAGQVSTATPAPAAQPKLKRNEVGLLGSTVFALAGAAPGQTVSIVLATLVVTSAYGTVLPLAISAIGLLCIAVAFQRLTRGARTPAPPTNGYAARSVLTSGTSSAG